jgi:hypothetical protein
MGSNISPRDSVHVAGAPNLPGLAFRRFRGELDYPAMVAVIEGSKEVSRFGLLRQKGFVVCVQSYKKDSPSSGLFRVKVYDTPLEAVSLLNPNPLVGFRPTGRQESK